MYHGLLSVSRSCGLNYVFVFVSMNWIHSHHGNKCQKYIFFLCHRGSVIDLDLFQQPTLQFNQPSCFIIAYLPKVWLKVASMVMMWALPTGQDKKRCGRSHSLKQNSPSTPFASPPTVTILSISVKKINKLIQLIYVCTKLNQYICRCTD